MHKHHIKTLADYVQFLRLNVHEVDNLLKDLLIGVTHFFRDTEAFDLLRYKIFPKFIKNKPADYCIRIWVPGCSTGEEAYSIAMLLHECLCETGKNINFQVFATDIDLNALDIARSGIYPEKISEDINPERLRRFFVKHLNHYKIKKEIRGKVVFGEQNIIKDPPFTKVDLICCRNLLIYLNTQIQKKILPLFHYSLKSKGVLFLGMTEATTGFGDYFQAISNKYKIFERKDVASNSKTLLNFDIVHHSHHTPSLNSEYEAVNKASNHAEILNNYILNNHVPPFLIVNKHGDIIFSNDHAEQYMRVSKNKKYHFRSLNNACPEIKMALIPILQKVIINEKTVIFENLKVKLPKKMVMINLKVISLAHINALRSLILVIFENTALHKIKELSYGKSSKKSNVRLGEVIQELQTTKENLQATIEELETGNEELQSANEELQSTNEEIETSKEELQSLNEELIIVNTELQGMIDQLATVNDDINNLFNSTEIAAFFLDNNLLIKRFTPKAQEVMHLIPADIGRPFSHFASTLKYENLMEYASDVLKTLHQKKYEVQSKDDRWYQIRILPYRTLTNVIDGVIITLTDITKFKEYEALLSKTNYALQDSLSFAENVINTVREPLLVLSSDLNIISANRSFYKIFKLDKNNESNVIGKFIYEISDKQFDIAELRELLTNVLTKNQIFEDFHLSYNFKKIGHKEFLLNARKIHSHNDNSDLILLTLGPN